MIPKVNGDAPPLGQRPLCVLPVDYRIWASARMIQLEEWFRSWVPGGKEVLLKLGILLPWTLRRCSLVPFIFMCMFLLLTTLSLLTLLIVFFFLIGFSVVWLACMVSAYVFRVSCTCSLAL